MLKRTLAALLLAVVGLPLIFLGGIPFAIMIGVVLAFAVFEFTRLFQAGGFQPSSVIAVVGVLLLAGGRYLDGFESSGWMITLLVLVTMAYHLATYERGRDQAATDFAITLAGIFYVGWLGVYLVSVRELPEGLGWLLVVLPSVWLADSGAYMVGSRIGRHKMTPRLSPKKSWEGYFGGVVAGTLGAALLAALWQAWAGPETALTPLRGAILGLVLSVLTTLGDLGESMIKRQFGVKDSGNLIPGHGGAFDRIDSWLWAGAIGYYVITWLFL